MNGLPSHVIRILTGVAQKAPQLLYAIVGKLRALIPPTVYKRNTSFDMPYATFR